MPDRGWPASADDVPSIEDESYVGLPPSRFSSGEHIVRLALDVCLDVDHPLLDRHPPLRRCPGLDEVVRELRIYLLAQSA